MEDTIFSFHKWRRICAPLPFSLLLQRVMGFTMTDWWVAASGHSHLPTKPQREPRRARSDVVLHIYIIIYLARVPLSVLQRLCDYEATPDHLASRAHILVTFMASLLVRLKPNNVSIWSYSRALWIPGNTASFLWWRITSEPPKVQLWRIKVGKASLHLKSELGSPEKNRVCHMEALAEMPF